MHNQTLRNTIIQAWNLIRDIPWDIPCYNQIAAIYKHYLQGWEDDYLWKRNTNNKYRWMKYYLKDKFNLIRWILILIFFLLLRWTFARAIYPVIQYIIEG